MGLYTNRMGLEYPGTEIPDIPSDLPELSDETLADLAEKVIIEKARKKLILVGVVVLVLFLVTGAVR